MKTSGDSKEEKEKKKERRGPVDSKSVGVEILMDEDEVSGSGGIKTNHDETLLE